MTRIGFAYNLKPDFVAPRAADEAELARPDEEPPSSGRPATTRARATATPGAPALAPAAVAAAPGAVPGASPEDAYAEWDSPETIDAVARALAAVGPVIRLEADEEFPARLRAERPDIVFNIAEGLHGVNREAHVPAICEFFGVPYSGSDPFTLSLCLDKARTKETLEYHGVPTAPFALVRDLEDLDRLLSRRSGATSPESGAGSRRGPRDGMATSGPVPDSRLLAPDASGSLLPTPDSFPLFAKPVHEGSSKGITEKNLCRTREELEAQVAFLLATYRQPVLVEAFLPGAEFTCAVLGNGSGAGVLPIIGMNFGALPAGALPIYGFEAKWLWDRPDNPLEMFECPARIDDALRQRIERVVLATYRVLGCRDWARVDVRLDAAGAPNVVEVNPLPGILPNPEDNSCFPKAARAAGMSYDALIQRCLYLAAERQGVPLPGAAARPVRAGHAAAHA